MKVSIFGVKLSRKQKQALMEQYVRGNRNLDDWRKIYPDVNPQSLAGLLSILNLREKQGLPIAASRKQGEDGIHASLAPSLAGAEASMTPSPASIPLPPTPPLSTPPLSASDAGPKKLTLADLTGFTPAGALGTVDTYDENAYGKWLIRRIEPREGIVGEEPHPFTSSDLMRKYGGGYYECSFITDGKPPQKHFVRVAGPPKPVSPSFMPPIPMAPGADRSASRSGSGLFNDLTRGLPVDPEDRLVRHFEAFSRIHEDAERKARERTSPDQREAAKIAGESSVAATAIQALTEATKGTQASNPILETLIRHQAEERKTLEIRLSEERKLQVERHEQDLVRERARAQQDLDRERERMRHELQVDRERMEREDRRQKEFYAKLQELEQKKTAIEQERWERIEKAHQESVESNQAWFQEEKRKLILEEERRRKDWQDRQDREQKHLDEVLALKRSIGADSSTETQRMWVNAVTDIFGRAERKIEMLAARSPAPHPALPHHPGINPSGTVPSALSASPMEDRAVSSADLIYKSQIFNDTFKGEINTHIENQNPAELFVGQLFGTLMLDPRSNIFIGYFLGRTWPQILREAEGRLDAEAMAIWKTAYAGKWFNEVRAMYFAELRRAREMQQQAVAQTAAPAPAPTLAPAGEPQVNAEVVGL